MKIENAVIRWAIVGGILTGFVVLIVSVGPAIVCADELSCGTEPTASGSLYHNGYCSLRLCDDYMRKSLPCVSKVPCCCADTYSRKPSPSLQCSPPCQWCCCPDNYRSKPIPSPFVPSVSAWYKCVKSPRCVMSKPAARSQQVD